MRPEILKKRAVEYRRRFEAELGHEWELLSEYNGNREPVSAKHIPCGVVTTKRPGDFFRWGCYTCAKAKAAEILGGDSSARKAVVKRRFDSQAAQYIDTIEKEYNVTAISEYKGYREPMVWRCNVCGAELRKKVDDILFRHDGYGGLKCDHGIKILAQERAAEGQTKRRLLAVLRKITKRRRMEEELLDLCIQYEANGYEVLDISDDLRTVKLRHLSCGREFTTTKASMKEGHGCKACSLRGTSYGVQHIERSLRERGISFAREVTFPTCKRVRVLPFDFAIYNADGELVFLIEYQGEQHYRARPMFGGEDKLCRVQEADAIKKQWAKDNGINLLIIDWNEDIDARLGAVKV